MKYFIIGDIHGCFYTMHKMLEKSWDIEKEKLIILGDIVNKGKHSFAVMAYLIQLVQKYPNQVEIIKGNNEYLFEKYYNKELTLSARHEFQKHNLDAIKTLDWLRQLPHFIEYKDIFISHAGVDINHTKPLAQDNLAILFTKEKLRDLGKTQFLGHVVVKEAFHDEEADAWYLDTGAGNGKKLTGAKVSENGELEDLIVLKVDKRDLA